MTITPAYRERIAQELAQLELSAEHLAGRALRLYAECAALIPIVQDGREFHLQPVAAAAWLALKEAAASDSIELQLVSAFRSVARQSEILRSKRDKGLAWAAILSASAPPGYSEHHSGLAVDLSTPGYAVLEESFANSPAFAWLQERAGAFGFFLSFPRNNPHGYNFEPWHWCHAGSALA